MDGLTELYNRKYIIERLFQEVSEAVRYSQHLSIILFCIDHFKQINAIHGDQVGNEVLMVVSGVIKSNLRKSDIAGRYSGDEFIIILPHTDNKGACLTANRLLKNINEIEWHHRGLNVTASGGVSTLKKEKNSLVIREDLLLYELIRRADDLLYKAKKAGRNRIEV
jgi:diguanylate cyclase (GGDEF)-like protein